MHIYIAYRNLEEYLFEHSKCGGVPVNNDYRLTTVKDDVYLLTSSDGNYAVAKQRAERFVDEVISGSTEKHPGSFPMIREQNGKKTAAVVEVSRDGERVYYDFDDELLLKMLDSLKAESEKLTDKRALINYCYPNPSLPEGDFDLKSIYHQIYAPDNTPPSVIMPERDRKTSSFIDLNGSITVEVREGQTKTTYDVPSELLPEIKNRVRELCREPAEAYVEVGNWEAFIYFGDDSERIFTDPDNTLALLKEIAAKSVFKGKKDIPLPQGIAAAPNNGLNGFMGFQSMFQQAAAVKVNPAPSQPASASVDGWMCSACGAKNKGKFCMECGSPRK